MKEIEIMAPAGSFASLVAAIDAGADSVYFGVGELNMRASSAANFTENDLETICEMCRKKGVKTYLTLNTVVYDREMARVEEVLEKAKKAEVSAVIASDFAVITKARELGLEVHLSTQSNLCNSAALRFYSQFADVVVASREMDLEALKTLCETIDKEDIKGPNGKKIKVEIFAHGALCMAISGKCYLSLDNYAKSANRGACLQLCRRPYRLSELPDRLEGRERKGLDAASAAASAASTVQPATNAATPAAPADDAIEIEVDNKYLMSPKDLKTVDFLDKLLQTGVSVLKIEGRGRTADYVKTVVGVYKEAVLAYQNGDYTEEKIEQWNKKLSHVYNRGFWQGYYMGKTIGEWSNRYGSQADRKKTYVGKVNNFFSKISVAEIKLESEYLEVGSEILIIGSTTGAYEGVLSEIRLDLKNVNRAEKASVISIPTTSPVHRGDKVFRVDVVEQKN